MPCAYAVRPHVCMQKEPKSQTAATATAAAPAKPAPASPSRSSSASDASACTTSNSMCKAPGNTAAANARNTRAKSTPAAKAQQVLQQLPERGEEDEDADDPAAMMTQSSEPAVPLQRRLASMAAAAAAAPDHALSQQRLSQQPPDSVLLHNAKTDGKGPAASNAQHMPSAFQVIAPAAHAAAAKASQQDTQDQGPSLTLLSQHPAKRSSRLSLQSRQLPAGAASAPASSGMPVDEACAAPTAATKDLQAFIADQDAAPAAASAEVPPVGGASEAAPPCPEQPAAGSSSTQGSAGTESLPQQVVQQEASIKAMACKLAQGESDLEALQALCTQRLERGARGRACVANVGSAGKAPGV